GGQATRTSADRIILQKPGLMIEQEAMEVLLLYNPVAGGGQRNGEVFRQLLVAHGYHCEAYATDDPRWRKRASRNAMVVVAGGDGTIKQVARQLVGSDIPLAILPIGTSNNIALSLKAFGSPTSLMSRWRTWHPQAIDVVSVTLGNRHCYAFEGCGLGLFGRWIHLGPY